MENYTEESPPIHSVASPPGIVKGGATGLQEAPLWNTPIPLTVQSLCAGGWKQGSPLPQCTGLRNPNRETAVLAGQAVFLGSCDKGLWDCLREQLEGSKMEPDGPGA